MKPMPENGDFHEMYGYENGNGYSNGNSYGFINGDGIGDGVVGQRRREQGDGDGYADILDYGAKWQTELFLARKSVK